MAIITAYKCTHDGKIFEHKDKYLAHLKKLARERALDRKIQATKDQRVDFIKQMSEKVTSFEQLESFIKSNWEWFYFNGLKENQWRLNRKNPGLHEHVSVTFSNMHWGDCISNSHSCPRGGVTNWSGSNLFPDGTHYPNGYPGWRGRITILVKTPLAKGRKSIYHDGFGSDYFKETGIHTGTGGGGGIKDGVTSYGYDVTLFASDWPAMAKRKAQSAAWEAVGGEKLIA